MRCHSCNHVIPRTVQYCAYCAYCGEKVELDTDEGQVMV